jgi:type ISP restriction-modification system protein
METAGGLWMHALAIGYSPAYHSENGDGIRCDWPRIPLPADKKMLLDSSALGRQIAELIDTQHPVSGVTMGKLNAPLSTVAAISHVEGGTIRPEEGELDITVGWGHPGKGGIVMPGKGKIIGRGYSESEQAAIAECAKRLGMTPDEITNLLGTSTFDVYLNDVALWRNIPARVWDYHIGGYQVIKKWLSYREHKLLGHSLLPDEAREVSNMARCITAILLLEPTLDLNYQKVTASTYAWPNAG